MNSKATSAETFVSMPFFKYPNIAKCKRARDGTYKDESKIFRKKNVTICTYLGAADQNNKKKMIVLIK